jgi:hypothetical protein
MRPEAKDARPDQPATGSEGQQIPRVPFVVESLDATEQRLSFRAGDSWCRVRSLDFASGARLAVTSCQFEPSFSFSVEQAPAEVELVVSKGAVLHTRIKDGRVLHRGGNVLQFGRTKRPLELHVRGGGDVATECVSISMSEKRLRELLGVSELPDRRARGDGSSHDT